jgi:mannosyltransferase
MRSTVLTGTSRTALLSVGLGLVAFLFHLIAIGRPGPWGDEAVTVLSVRRGLDSLATSLKIHDLVYGPYYIVGHFWGSVVGTDVVHIRVLSALSVGVATGLMVVLGAMLLGLRFGVYSALLFTTLPRVIWSATEARATALVTAVVIATMICFLLALRRDSVGSWCAYGVLLMLSVLLFEFAALNFLVLPLVMLALPLTRGVVIRWCVTTALAALATAPFLLQTTRQAHRMGSLNWVAQSFTLRDALKAISTSQFLLPEGVAGWIRIDAMVWLIGLGGILLAAWRARQDDPAVRVTVVLTTGWLVLPTAVLLAYSLVATPVFEERYVAASAPPLAMAMALALVCVPSPRGNRVVAAVLVVLLMSLFSGAWERYHQTWAKSGWLSISQAVQANKKPGDVVVAAGPLEADAVVVLPDEFSGLDVINVKVPYYADNTPWGTVTMIRDDPKLLNGLHRVWYLSVDGITAADAAAFKQQGFTERWSNQELGLGAILYERD